MSWINETLDNVDASVFSGDSFLNAGNREILRNLMGRWERELDRIEASQAEDVLAVPMQENDAEAATVGDYLRTLLMKVWTEGEGFSGKRPFGNSGYQYEVYTALVRADMVEGEYSEDFGLDDVDSKAADVLIEAAIRSLGVSNG